MFFLYSLLLACAVLALLPVFLIAALRHGKYVAGLAERMGGVPVLDRARPVIWLHCVSVGETRDEALTLIRQAIELHIEDLRQTGQPIPAPSSSGELIEVPAA